MRRLLPGLACRSYAKKKKTYDSWVASRRRRSCELAITENPPANAYGFTLAAGVFIRRSKRDGIKAARIKGPGKHFRGAPKHFHRAPLERIFLNFSFQNGTFWRTLYFWPTAGPPKRRGPAVAYPLILPSQRAWPGEQSDANLWPKMLKI